MLSSQFACCLGDTLASELGILSSSPPILITTLKTVPAGTNGGISVGGTIASGVGGCIVGLSQFVSLVVENSVCRAEWASLLPTLMGWGTAAGILGSMVCIVSSLSYHDHHTIIGPGLARFPPRGDLAAYALLFGQEMGSPGRIRTRKERVHQGDQRNQCIDQ